MRFGNGSAPAVYYGTLLIALCAYSAFTIFFLKGYFDPYYFTEARATAHLQTVVGFLGGINPYDNAHLDEFGNLYSVVWPYLNYLIASALGLSGYFEIKALMMTLNAVFIFGAAAAAVYVAYRNGVNALLSLGIGFSFVLLNTTKMTMGEFSYAGGAAAGFLALILTNTKFDWVGFVNALCLVTLASLFKIYFAVFGVVVIVGYAAFLPMRTLVPTVIVWLIATYLTYAGLSQAFPNYFEAIFGVIFTDVRHEYFRIVTQLGWFLLNFGFVLAFAVPVLIQLPNATVMERRRQAYYVAASLIVTGYVVFGMLTNIGNFGTYLLNLVAPLILAYAVRRRERTMNGAERIIGVAATLFLCVTIFLVPKYDGTETVRWTGWKAYGVADRNALGRNRETVAEIERLLSENMGRKIYLDFPLAPVAIAAGLDYVDNGNREFIARHKVRSIAGERRGEGLVRFIAIGNNFDPVTNDPLTAMREADLVVCMLRCPRPNTHRKSAELGSIYMAYNAREFPVAVYLRADEGGDGPSQGR